jgi:hypothetical protein
LEVDISQKNQIILLEPVQRIAITGFVQGSVLESGLGNGAMEQSNPMRDFRGEFVDGREGRESSGNTRGRIGKKGILNSHKTNANVLYLIVARLIKVMEIGDIILHDGCDQVLLFRQVLAIIMVAPNDNGGGNGRQTLEEMDCHFNARGSNTVLVMEEIACDNNK